MCSRSCPSAGAGAHTESRERKEEAESLEEAFFERKKDAAPGVDRLTWEDYEALKLPARDRWRLHGIAIHDNEMGRKPPDAVVVRKSEGTPYARQLPL
jgi:hypothetical protein